MGAAILFLAELPVPDYRYPYFGNNHFYITRNPEWPFGRMFYKSYAPRLFPQYICVSCDPVQIANAQRQNNSYWASVDGNQYSTQAQRFIMRGVRRVEELEQGAELQRQRDACRLSQTDLYHRVKGELRWRHGTGRGGVTTFAARC